MTTVTEVLALSEQTPDVAPLDSSDPTYRRRVLQLRRRAAVHTVRTVIASMRSTAVEVDQLDQGDDGAPWSEYPDDARPIELVVSASVPAHGPPADALGAAHHPP